MSLKVSKIEQLFQQAAKEEIKPGLYVIATDIGNPADITVRALAVLSRVDFIICEERRIGESFCKRYGIDKPLELLNEHNEAKNTVTLLHKMITSQIRAALISDNGTPLFADPGSRLVKECLYHRIPVFPIPGASSLMAALMTAGRKSQRFFYYGFLPAAKEERIKELRQLKDRDQDDTIFLETPYRLKQFLRDMRMVLGKQREGIIAYRLTCPEERIISGNLTELETEAEKLPKGEFVFILLGKEGFRRRK
jgi:16S rRNA (cytidine1402-2'-O)-methyltransferase